MIIKRGISHKIQMPEKYESVTVMAEVTVDTEELPEGTWTLKAVAAEVQKRLDEVIAADLDNAAALAADESYVKEWNE